jgi:hypothetical protein
MLVMMETEFLLTGGAVESKDIKKSNLLFMSSSVVEAWWLL